MEIKHQYGKNIHILDNPVLLSVLAKLGHPDTVHPQLPQLLRLAYQLLAAQAFARELPVEVRAVPTRMRKYTTKGIYKGPILRQQTKVVVAAIARAGLVPGELCFEMLNQILDPASVRLDHVSMARVTDAKGHVTGVSLGSSKIGGSLQGRILVIPDPMAATGSTIVRLLEYYRENYGIAQKVITLPLIATPEFLWRMHLDCPQVLVYTARVDRGLSSSRALKAIPGKYWKEEQGLNQQQYIVPGAGGMGEVLTNSWV